jgi:hypothetical protein
LAWVGGALYTTILFEPKNVSSLNYQYAWISFLLFAWLMVYLTIGLLGSVLASSVTMAAGLSVLGAIILMVVGSIPQISALMPGALTAWADQVATASELPPFNGGALAIAAIISIVGLVTAVAIFEQQEL